MPLFPPGPKSTAWVAVAGLLVKRARPRPSSTTPKPFVRSLSGRASSNPSSSRPCKCVGTDGARRHTSHHDRGLAEKTREGGVNVDLSVPVRQREIRTNSIHLQELESLLLVKRARPRPSSTTPKPFVRSLSGRASSNPSFLTPRPSRARPVRKPMPLFPPGPKSTAWVAVAGKLQVVTQWMGDVIYNTETGECSFVTIGPSADHQARTSEN
jgi:hypothetical protein